MKSVRRNELWLRGLVRRLPGRLLGAAACIAVAVSLLATLAGFLAAAKTTMTARATRSVAVDWQIAVQPGADAGTVLDTTRADPGTSVADPVGFGDALGLSTVGVAGIHTTAAAVVVGVPDGYLQHFPDAVRTLIGSPTGVALTQQTASNLGAGPGTRVTVWLPGGATATETVNAIVELPQADSLFQSVGAPARAQPSAPPDNVLLVPAADFDTMFTPVRALDPAAVRTQVHARRTRDLPGDPAAAFVADTGQARHLEATLSGAGVVGDNLGATLDGARQDALYSQVLFLFLGLPGAGVAAVLATTITASGGARRRREQALLRARGATARQIAAVAGVEATAVGMIGAAAGLAAGLAVQRWVLETPASPTGSIAAFGVGLILAAATVLTPALREMRSITVTAARAPIGRTRTPRWRLLGLDFVALAGAFVLYRVTGRAGYTLVLAPEGVGALSVSYWAFLAPGLLWIGLGLLTLRLIDVVLGTGRPLLRHLLRPFVGTLSGTVAAMLARQRTTLGRAAAVIALAAVFAVSTAVFTSTYRQQAAVDARLTAGADVTVTEPPAATVGPGFATELHRLPGVRTVEPIQHRYAYVGTDLQDLYGVDPTTIGHAALLQDSYFDGGTAAELLGRLATQPDGLLVSAETVTDFQLAPGDQVNLRIQEAGTTAVTTVPFRLVGVVKEFPTAPKDSFLVANATYLSAVTGNPAVGAFLVDTAGGDTAAVRQAVSDITGPGAVVTDITTARGAVGSTLTAVDLGGLTRLELSYAVVLAAGGAAVVLAAGFTERRRTFAIVTALGGTRAHASAIVLAEATVVTGAGVLIGILGGTLLSELLVTVLTGVFDPPPTALAVPWAYLALVGAATTAAVAVFTALSARAAAAYPITALRS